MPQTYNTLEEKEWQDAMDDNQWGKPASDILNGLESISDVKPVRAIWEMIQNARDVANGECHIVFELHADKFVFKHNGKPFTPKTLLSLILQTSAKVREDVEQVGQYGTGFLTTHLFGLRFKLSGALECRGKSVSYYNFTDLVIDRSAATRGEMKDSLRLQSDTASKWVKEDAARDDTPCEWTKFEYEFTEDSHKQRAAKAFEAAPKMLPYVMALNSQIHSVRFINRINGEECRFTDETSHKVICLQSEETLQTESGKSIPMVTVMPPIETIGERVAVRDIDEDDVHLFVYLPLLGSNKWHINAFVHSPFFTLANERRDMIRVTANAKSQEEKVSLNHKIVSNARQLFFDYVGEHCKEWSNTKALAHCAMKNVAANEDDATFYEKLHNEWIDNLKKLPIVELADNSRICPTDIFVVDRTLCDAIKDNAQLHEVICTLLDVMHSGYTPFHEELIYWSDIIEEWYNGKENAQQLSLQHFVDYIDQHGADAISEQQLYILLAYIKETGNTHLFQKKLFPSLTGGLVSASDGLNTSALQQYLLPIASTLLNEKYQCFVKSQFLDIHNFAVFGKTEFIAAIQSEASEWKEKLKSNQLLPDNVCGAMLSLCKMAVSASSEGFSPTIVRLIEEYYGKDVQVEKLDGQYDTRGIRDTLIHNVLQEFGLLSIEDKLDKKAWLLDVVKALYGFSDNRHMLASYPIYPTQANAFKCDKELRKCDGLNEDMKNVYDQIMESSCRDYLVDDAFAPYTTEAATWELLTFGSEIQKKIKESVSEYPSRISDYKHKNAVMDIINHFGDDANNTWNMTFPGLHTDRALLVLSLVQDNAKRKHIFEIIKTDEARLSKLADLAKEENLDMIIELGRKAYEAECRRKQDIDYKKQLGESIEYHIQAQLQSSLIGKSLSVVPVVDDEQCGQDLIVRIDNRDVYYIEIKSRWVKRDSFLMSALQLSTSVEHKDRYALLTIDMSDYSQEMALNHEYPKDFSILKANIKVIPQIGELNKEIAPAMRDSDKQVHLSNDYKCVVPQYIVQYYGITYDDFVQTLVELIRKEI